MFAKSLGHFSTHMLRKTSQDIQKHEYSNKKNIVSSSMVMSSMTFHQVEERKQLGEEMR
jgi:hypothetical protein